MRRFVTDFEAGRATPCARSVPQRQIEVRRQLALAVRPARGHRFFDRGEILPLLLDLTIEDLEKVYFS